MPQLQLKISLVNWMIWNSEAQSEVHPKICSYFIVLHCRQVYNPQLPSNHTIIIRWHKPEMSRYFGRILQIMHQWKWRCLFFLVLRSRWISPHWSWLPAPWITARLIDFTGFSIDFTRFFIDFTRCICIISFHLELYAYIIIDKGIRWVRKRFDFCGGIVYNLAKLQYFINLDFPEIRGTPFLSYLLGWGRVRSQQFAKILC